jgi:hypothetical protein
MKKKLFLTLTLFLFFTSMIYTQDLSPKLSWNVKENKNSIALIKNGTSAGSNHYSFLEKANLKSRLISDAEFNARSNSLDIARVKKTVSHETGIEKSVWLGAGLSALLPGAGEFYGKNYLKAAIFLGIEIAGWGAYAYFQKKGDNQTIKFQNYADTYWNVRTYAAWLVSQGFLGNGNINPNEPDREVLRHEIMQCESLNFSHTLPEYGDQQFYELIGKYQNFEAGWANLAHVPTKDPGPYYYETYHDPIVVNYAYDRQKANDYYNYGTTSVIVVVVNHILSAADAAWTVSMFNKKLKMQSGFEIKRYFSPYTFNYENEPALNMKVTF